MGRGENRPIRLSPLAYAPAASTAVCTPSSPTSTAACPPGGYAAVCACPPPTSASDPDYLKFDIAVWIRFVIAFLAAAVFFIVGVMQRVDAAAKAEARAASEEAKAYKAALDEQSAACTAVKEAEERVITAVHMFPPPALGAPDPSVTAAWKTHWEDVWEMKIANKKVEDKKPMLGVARMGVVERKVVRGPFVLAILCSLATGICAAGAFYRSVELQMGDSISFGTIAMFAVPGVPMILAHLYFLYVAVFEN